MSKRRKKIVAVDLFCGGGGTSTGLLQACAELGFDNVDLTAVNHWRTAIDTHSANHPHARHECARIEELQPERLVPGGHADILWASPECIEHSVAKGGRPKNDQSRCQAFTVLDWIQRLTPSVVFIENVPEFVRWGPIYASGPKKHEPIPSRRGESFNAWVAAMESLNYRCEWRMMTCADYGDATTRRRFFLQARRGNAKCVWPGATHVEDPGGLIEMPKWRSAAEIIDWSIPGHSIFLTRQQCREAKLRVQRPLAKNTMKRIEAGIKRFWGEWAKPFLIVLNGGGWSEKPIKVDVPVPTVVCGGNHVGLVEPFFVRFNGERTKQEARVHLMEAPLPVQDTSNRYGLCRPILVPQDARGANRDIGTPIPTVTTTTRGMGVLEPLVMSISQTGSEGLHVRRAFDPIATMTTKADKCVVRPFLIKYYGSGVNVVDTDCPIDTVTTNDTFGLVRPFVCEIGGERYLLDILFRMLTPAELAAAHSFPPDYIWKGTKTDIVKQIGNSVPVMTAAALCREGLVA